MTLACHRRDVRPKRQRNGCFSGGFGLWPQKTTIKIATSRVMTGKNVSQSLTAARDPSLYFPASVVPFAGGGSDG
jgi:hypothetical protein